MTITIIPGNINEAMIQKVSDVLRLYENDNECFDALMNLVSDYGPSDVYDAVYYAAGSKDALKNHIRHFEDILFDEQIDDFFSRMTGREFGH